MVLQPSTQPKATTQRRKKCLLLILAVIIVPLVMLIAWYMQQEKPNPEVYYSENFTEGVDTWQGIDSTWLSSEGTQQGVIRLARHQFAAPYLMKYLPLEQAPPENFVWHFRVRVNAFTEEATTLCTIILPNGPLAVVVNVDGRLGLAQNLFRAPTYSTEPLSRLTFEDWHDIYVHFNYREQKVVLYLDGRRILTETWVEPTYPVLEIWLGAIWLKGAAPYGAPLGIYYSSVNLGNEGLLPRPSLIEFTLEHLPSSH